MIDLTRTYSFEDYFTDIFKDVWCELYEGNVYFPSDKDKPIILQPDIVIISSLEEVKDDGYYGAPEMIVEVLSKSTQHRDWRYKYNIYESRGVKEYWICSPLDRQITVFQREGSIFGEGVCYNMQDEIPVGIFNGEKITLRSIL